MKNSQALLRMLIEQPMILLNDIIPVHEKIMFMKALKPLSKYQLFRSGMLFLRSSSGIMRQFYEIFNVFNY